MNLSKELLAKAKTAKTAEELMGMAKAEKIELTAEQATAYFTRLNQATGELADEEIDNVAGGLYVYPVVDEELYNVTGGGCGDGASRKPGSGYDGY